MLAGKIGYAVDRQKWRIHEVKVTIHPGWCLVWRGLLPDLYPSQLAIF